MILYVKMKERKRAMKTAIYHSPFGQMELSYEEGGVISLRMAEEGTKGEAPFGLALTVFRELDEYFQGRRKTFDFPCRTQGTAFQEKVWAALREIPYGETRSYRDIAEAIGHPKAYRAVGMANNANPLFIIIPCHRVIGADGSLTGYGGGLPMKKALLMLEKKHSIS
ncbi:methylated-DNA--[protein]-cysteine S-methyltransferase [Dialister succinatiphilus]|uniref:methylated-DNA--[protein]-cysteine S-methyltransferase n=1 Tax=Dialister succinatiphilus TaxID=487173 RepID=UPI00402609A1